MPDSSKKRKPKYDETIDGVRVRVYATRGEFEVIEGDGDIDADDADVSIYPKVGTADAWAAQYRVERRTR